MFEPREGRTGPIDLYWHTLHIEDRNPGDSPYFRYLSFVIASRFLVRREEFVAAPLARVK